MQIPQIGEEGQNKLLSSKVLVAGAGGLGSTVIANLSSAGIGKIGIIDSDKLEITNYNRQYIHKFSNLGKEKVYSAKEYISEFNPEIEVETYNFRLTNDNYKDVVTGYDIIIDCFDSLDSKFLLNKIAVDLKKPLIHAGVSETNGQVTTIVPFETACLECLFGHFTEKEYQAKGVLSPVITTIASIQAMEAVKLILNIGTPLKNRLLCIDGLKTTFKELKISKNHRCSLCGK